MTWMKDGERYSRMEPNAETGGMDIVTYRAKDNRREVIIPLPCLSTKKPGSQLPSAASLGAPTTGRS